MTAVLPRPVDYVAAARRHHLDAQTLLNQGRSANAGQLFGLAMECGLKALLLASGVPPDTDGSLPNRKNFRQHMPELSDRINLMGHLIPDGKLTNTYLAMIPGRTGFNSWSVDQRYWRDSALPLADLPAWAKAATEVGNMLDQATQDGVL